MSWNNPIRVLQIASIFEKGVNPFGDEFSECCEGTILLKHRKKVVAVCHLEYVGKSGWEMCTYRTITWALKIDKVRRPAILEAYLEEGLGVGDVAVQFEPMEFL